MADGISSEQEKGKEPLRFSLGSRQKTASPSSLLYGSVLTAVLFLGWGGCLYGLVAPESYWPVVLVVGCITGIGAYIGARKPKVLVVGLAVLVVLFAGLAIAFFSVMSDGLKLVANQVGNLVGASTARVFTPFEIEAPPEASVQAATLFLMPLSVVLGLWCGYSVKRFPVVANLVGMAALFTAAVFLRVYPPLWATALLVCTQALLAAGRFGIQESFMGREAKAYMQAQAATALVAVLVVGITAAAIPAEYQLPQEAEQTRKATVRAVDEARFGYDASTGMPDGNLVGLGPLELSEKPALKVTMQNPESLWLRGFVGSEYTGSSWDEPDPVEPYENEGLFYWLHQDGFYGQTQLAQAAYLLDQKVEAFAMSIENVGASSRNIYAPYEVSWADGDLLPADGIGDSHLYSLGLFGDREYGYLTFPNQVKQYPQLAAALDEKSQTSEGGEPKTRLGSYIVEESYYAAYADARYLTLDDDQREFFDRYLAPYLNEGESDSYTYYKQAIITCLTENTEYDEDVDSSFASEDFVTAFLSTGKRGYSVHYASAATLMFRYCGIPARYVEGYLITPSDVEGIQGSAAITLDGTHAHAWTEIYLDGLGWIPVEVTPPYFGLMEEPGSFEGVPGAAREEEELELENTGDETSFEPNIAADDKGFDRMLFFTVALSLIVLVLAVFLILWLVRRHRVIKAREAMFMESDNVAAVLAMFDYSMRLLHAVGLRKDGIVLFGHIYEGMEALDMQARYGFESLFGTYERAAYAASSPNDGQRAEAYEEMLALCGEVRSRCKGFKSLYVRFVLCLF